MKNLLHRVFVEEGGQGAIEYALIIAIVVIGLIAGLSYMTDQLHGSTEAIGDLAEEQTDEAIESTKELLNND